MCLSKTIVLGVTGGIAAYKALDLVSKLKKKNIDVHVIMTESAAKFVTPLSFQALSQNMVVYDMFAEPKSFEIQHISLAAKADLFVIAPASANIIGKVANGIADDMLSTTIMATKNPVLFAPAMNTNMYENPIVQKNISNLKSYGYHFIEPDEGRLACGSQGKGKLADVDKIIDYIDMLLCTNKDLKGKKVLVTAGPTREDIDPFRYLTNHSSGKMGYAICRAARNRGAEVTLITGPTNIASPIGVKVVNTYSAEDMYNAVKAEFLRTDILIKSAAVSDYKPKTRSSIKIKKSDTDLFIELSRTKDILLEMSKIKKNQFVIGFAAETNDIEAYGRNKLNHKNLDMIVINDISKPNAGFGVDTNTATIITKDGSILNPPNMTKNQLADIILDTAIKSI